MNILFLTQAADLHAAALRDDGRGRSSSKPASVDAAAATYGEAIDAETADAAARLRGDDLKGLVVRLKPPAALEKRTPGAHRERGATSTAPRFAAWAATSSRGDSARAQAQSARSRRIALGSARAATLALRHGEGSRSNAPGSYVDGERVEITLRRAARPAGARDDAL